MNPIPTQITLHKQSKILEIGFDDGNHFKLSCEYLRVYSPSAEVKGHGPGQEILQLDKENVNISAIEPIGNYAVRLVFDDGHNTGLYSWDVLHRLGLNYQKNWDSYIKRLEIAGHQRHTK